MNWVILVGFDWSTFVHRRTGDVKDTTHDAIADGHGNRFAEIEDVEAALETFGAGHGNGADTMVPELLLHFESELDGIFLNFKVDGEGVVDAGNCVQELHIYDGSDDLD